MSGLCGKELMNRMSLQYDMKMMISKIFSFSYSILKNFFFFFILMIVEFKDFYGSGLGNPSINITMMFHTITGISVQMQEFDEPDCISRFNECLTFSQTSNFRLYQAERVCRRQFQI